MDWSKIKYFKSAEFDSKDAAGSGEMMQEPFVLALDALRAKWGHPLHVSSGFRTPERNAAVEGKPNSAHLRGWAADLDTSSLADAMRLACLAAMNGFHRLGIDLKGGFIHVDQDPSLPTPAVWFYNV